MAQVKSTDTKPEIVVRKWLHKHGFRFRLHRSDLPGKPDIILPKHKTAIFVHGCFWHRHERCRNASMPASNTGYWNSKFEKTVARDAKNIKELEGLGWNVVLLWECEIAKGNYIEILRKILSFPEVRL